MIRRNQPGRVCRPTMRPIPTPLLPPTVTLVPAATLVDQVVTVTWEL